MNSQMQSFERPDCTVFYRIIPGLMDQDTVFLHGNLASSRWWYPVTDVLKSNPRGSKNAVFVDWRGCGNSNNLSDDYVWSPKDAADDCTALINFLVSDGRIDSTNLRVVGHSTGCLIALYCLDELSDQFSRAVLLDPVTPFGFELDPGVLYAMGVMRQDRNVARTVLAGTIRGVSQDDEFFLSLVDDCLSVSRCIWEGVPKAVANVGSPPDLKRITTQVMVLHGLDDQVLSLEDSERLAEALPHGTFVKLTGAGHSLNVEDPVRFCAYLA